ncbi:PREDICTED: uncharacterized protein LOC104699675 [Camelina sativa]|uniref:Uncharacterized protein LOC104699675 n=1 Tax=Camelina sativa TaxID=90675 RepID=A0ABM0SM92_CAMSA|nr:PREDICTED: uncharacterized protein LOC104699675 [Camelina sativa]
MATCLCICCVTKGVKSKLAHTTKTLKKITQSTATELKTMSLSSLVQPGKKTMSDIFPGDYATAETGVFWDIEQCEIPVGELNANEVLEKIRSNLSSFGHRGPLSIRAYGDLTGHDFPAGDIKLNHFPAGHRYARQKQMLEDLVSWSAEHPEPCTLMLILGDTSHDFVEVVGRLKSTKNYQVLLIQPGDDDPIDQSGSVDNNNMRNRKKRRRCTCTCRGRSFSLGVAYKLKMKCKRCRIKKSKSPKVEKQSGRSRERSSVAKPNGDECSVGNDSVISINFYF